MTTIMAVWGALCVGFLLGALWAGLVHTDDEAPRNLTTK